MRKEVLYFAEEIVCDDRPPVSSGQSLVFFGRCPIKNQRIVVKQINIENNAQPLIKELQVFQLFIGKSSLP